MASNPYAHPQTLDDAAAIQPRTSALAVSSLVFGIICCIPGSGLLATILGGAGLIRISQSEGRLQGKALSVIGLVLGLLSSAFWIACAVGAMAFFGQAGSLVKPLDALQAGDYAAARTALSSSASKELTDERAKEFLNEVKTELGAYQSPPKGLGQWMGDYSQLGPVIEKSPLGPNVVPIPVHFEKGLAFAYVHLDSTSSGSGKPLISNLELHTLDGKTLWLIEPGTKAGGPKAPPTPSGPTGK